MADGSGALRLEPVLGLQELGVPLQLLPLSHALAMASIAENMAGDGGAARRLLDEAHAVAAALDDVPATLTVLQARTLNGFFTDDLDTDGASSSEGVRLSREVGDLYSLDMMLMNAGPAALIAGDREASGPPLAEALRIAHQIDDRVASSSQ